MVNVGPVIINRDLSGPRVVAGGFVIEENNIGFYTLGIKNAGWQTKDNMRVGCFKQFLAYGFSGSAFEQ